MKSDLCTQPLAMIHSTALPINKALIKSYNTAAKEFQRPTFPKSESGSPVINPADYVLTLFPAGTKRRRYCLNPNQSLTEAQTDAYTMEAVRAIRSQDTAQLRSMLESGISLDACNSNGESLLHLACRRGNVATVQFLLEEAYVPADVKDSMGRTILHDICWRPAPNLELLAAVLKHVSPELLIAEDTRGHTCFDYCRREHWNQWINFLEQSSATIQLRASQVC